MPRKFPARKPRCFAGEEIREFYGDRAFTAPAAEVDLGKIPLRCGRLLGAARAALAARYCPGLPAVRAITRLAHPHDSGRSGPTPGGIPGQKGPGPPGPPGRNIPIGGCPSGTSAQRDLRIPATTVSSVRRGSAKILPAFRTEGLLQEDCQLLFADDWWWAGPASCRELVGHPVSESPKDDPVRSAAGSISSRCRVPAVRPRKSSSCDFSSGGQFFLEIHLPAEPGSSRISRRWAGSFSTVPALGESARRSADTFSRSVSPCCRANCSAQRPIASTSFAGRSSNGNKRRFHSARHLAQNASIRARWRRCSS